VSLTVPWPTPPFEFHQVAVTSTVPTPWVRVSRPSLIVPPPWTNPLAGMWPSSFELAAVPFTPRNALAGWPPNSLAFSFGTCTLLLTVSGGVVEVQVIIDGLASGDA